MYAVFIVKFQTVTPIETKRDNMTEPRRRKLRRRDKSVRCWQGSVVLSIQRAGRRRPGSPYGASTKTSRVAYGKREWTVQLAIWRVGQRHPSSPYGEWDGDVPARHTSSWMRSISSFSYLQVIGIVGEWWLSFFPFHCSSPESCLLITFCVPLFQIYTKL